MQLKKQDVYIMKTRRARFIGKNAFADKSALATINRALR